MARSWRCLLAVLLAIGAILAPAAPPAARAAEGLDIAADATYRVDVDDAVVRVRIDLELTNRTPDRTTATGTTRYYFEAIYLPLQDGARNVRATSGGATLGTTVSTVGGSRRLTVRFPDLYYLRSRQIRVDYDLVAGAPRSDSDIRVGPAFATFTAWAFGDPRRSTVRIVLPAGFEDDGYGDDVTTSVDGGRQIQRSGTIADPGAWYRVVIADRPDALTAVRVGTEDEPIVIHAWPDDPAWRDTVSRVLADGVPVLQDLIDLPWPVLGDLDVYEMHTPLLEGYGGFYDPGADEIRITEDLDPHLILHEASHAWFDVRFAGQRWISEGLADTYAALAMVAIERDEPDPAPARVSPDDEAAFPLADWPPPAERIDSDEIAAREDYGYDAAWTVMEAIVRDVGEDGMRDVFQVLRDRKGAYAQEGRMRHDLSPGGWRRFLDLIEEIGDASPMTERFRDWVARPANHDELDARLDARAALGELDAAGDGWAAPWSVLAPMTRWRFDEARAAMVTASRVLAARDDLAAAEVASGLASPDDLEARYEDIEDDDDAAALIDVMAARADAAMTLVAARDALAVEPSVLARIGLIDAQPAAGLAAGTLAYAAGDVDGATAGAAASIAILAGAEAIGQTRVITALAIAFGVLLTLAMVGLVWRRRRRRRSAAIGPAGVALAAADASTTLAATPAPGGIDAMRAADRPTSATGPAPVVPDGSTPVEPHPITPAPGADAD